MRLTPILLLTLAACSGTAEREPPATTDPLEAGDGGAGGGLVCEPDETATVYRCGDGWRITWTGQALICGELTGDCVPTDTLAVAICNGGDRVLSFPSVDPPQCEVECINPPEDVCNRTCSGLTFVGCACAAECPLPEGACGRTCDVARGVCGVIDC